MVKRTFLLLALSGCADEARIEAPPRSSGEDQRLERKAAQEPKKTSKGQVRSEAASPGKKKDVRPSSQEKGEKGERGEPSSAAAAEEKRPPAKKAKSSSADEVAVLIGRLKQDPAAAGEAFRRIWEIPKALIPKLLEEVENPESSKLDRIQVLVLDPDFLRPGELKPFLANRIHGLGRMEVLSEAESEDLRIISQEYTKMSYGITANKHYKVVIERFGGFPIGVVVRAGLINRFKSTRYPAANDDEPGAGKLVAWWRDFYARARSDLKDVAPSGTASPPRPKAKG